MNDPVWKVTLEGQLDGVELEMVAGIQAATAEKARAIAARLYEDSEYSEVRVVDVSPAGGPGQHPRRRPAGGDDIRRQKGGGL